MTKPACEALDLLVVGAGPAGCAAAIQARRAGLRVMILEATARPPPAPGETLHPGIEPIFERLGVADAIRAAQFHRHRGAWIEWDVPCRFEAYGEDPSGPWLGFQAERRRLHEILLRAALDLGAELRRPAAPQAVITDGTEVSGVVVDGRALRATWTADATGRRAWLAGQLGLAKRACSPPMRVRFGWRDDGPALHGEPRIAATPRGWDWRAPLGGGRTAWVSLSVNDPGEDARHEGGADVTWRLHPLCAGPGYFLLGDAAATLDPSSSHGVLRALMSGMLCAHVVANCRGGAMAPSAAAESYRAWMQGQFEHDVHFMQAFYRRHPSPGLAALFAAPADA